MPEPEPGGLYICVVNGPERALQRIHDETRSWFRLTTIMKVQFNDVGKAYFTFAVDGSTDGRRWRSWKTAIDAVITTIPGGPIIVKLIDYPTLVLEQAGVV